ncbi:MAG: multiprotein bridging factor aMBF1 [Promethearchaeota archaeon]
MPKSRYNDLDKECPICGGIIWGRGQRVLIEGAKIVVCDNCAQHGKKIYRPPSNIHSKNTSHVKPQTISKKQRVKSKDVEELEIVADYAKKIRNARTNLNLNQDQFAQKLNEKPSLLRRIEAGKVEPTVKLAKKIYKIYNIQLIKKPNDPEINIQETKFMKRSGGSSLGDIAFIKKRSKDSDS